MAPVPTFTFMWLEGQTNECTQSQTDHQQIQLLKSFFLNYVLTTWALTAVYHDRAIATRRGIGVTFGRILVFYRNERASGCVTPMFHLRLV